MTNAYINLCKKNLTSALSWKIASFKNHFEKLQILATNVLVKVTILKISESDVLTCQESLYRYYYGFAMPDDHKPCTSVEDRTLFTVTHYQDCEHYFTVFLKTDSLRFKFVTSDKLRFANFYAINDQIFYQACSFDLFSVWATPTQPQKSGNVSRTTPHNDVKNILKSRRKSHYSISEPASSTPITPTFPIESISATHDITSANLSQPSNTLNKNMFQIINHDSNKKISKDFHNLDPSSFISFTKIKDVATETNTGSVQNIKALILSKTSRYSENQFTHPKISPTKEKKISNTKQNFMHQLIIVKSMMY
ncbi:hypothetical protein Glove_151g29 [Diversispora epigaea]|uniref:Uncharacterized protein n=1 Tax=Diversispora epigaea TaxID=1348612 RepID=A0A397IZE9_9GLOM|nr:hypothetical protein Glove_151g30 [Diversispora epigaea]RHZ79156.1 hypothetical protein Glove_151g29 [Diversispora epigaea]